MYLFRPKRPQRGRHTGEGRYPLLRSRSRAKLAIKAFGAVGPDLRRGDGSLTRAVYIDITIRRKCKECIFLDLFFSPPKGGFFVINSLKHNATTLHRSPLQSARICTFCFTNGISDAIILLSKRKQKWT